MQRHRLQEFIRFLNAIEKTVPTKKTVHVMLDNYAPHKHPKVIAWLSRHPRVTFHFAPTSASWLNAVEGFFAALTKRGLKRGASVGIVNLQAAINRCVENHNTDPKPFRWKANPDKIIAAAARGHQTLDSIHQHSRRFRGHLGNSVLRAYKLDRNYCEAWRRASKRRVQTPIHSHDA